MTQTSRPPSSRAAWATGERHRPYLAEMEETDRAEPMTEAKVERLTERIGRMREEMERLKRMETEVASAPDGQVSLTDPDARSMNDQGSAIVGYNVQAAVDAKHHLIIANGRRDGPAATGRNSAPWPSRRAMHWAEAASRWWPTAATSTASSSKSARSKGSRIAPKSLTSGSALIGLFGKLHFAYDRERDLYVCPAGQELTKGSQRVGHDKAT